MEQRTELLARPVSETSSTRAHIDSQFYEELLWAGLRYSSLSMQPPSLQLTSDRQNQWTRLQFCGDAIVI